MNAQRKGTKLPVCPLCGPRTVTILDGKIRCTRCGQLLPNRHAFHAVPNLAPVRWGWRAV